MMRQHSKLPTEQRLPNEARSFLIRPFLIETDPCETHESPHRHNFQEILWVRSGRGEHAIDGRIATKPYEVGRNYQDVLSYLRRVIG